MLISPTRRLALAFATVVSVSLAACSEDANAPYVELQGGGFIFNYRVADVFYGVSLKPVRQLAKGTLLEAEFANPAGGQPYVVRETVVAPKLTYMLRTPPVTGVVKDQVYKVVVRVKAPDTGVVLQELQKNFHSDLDQDMNPAEPLTIGPGYTRNPDSAETRRVLQTPPQ